MKSFKKAYMKQPTTSYGRTLTGAIALTCLAVISLIGMISSKDDDDVLSLVLTIALTIVSSLQWARFVKQYIDFAIEEELKDRKIVEIAIQEKIKKLEEKE